MPVRRSTEADGKVNYAPCATPPKHVRVAYAQLGSLRRKHGGAARTGQACDRCKLRKIRCDARPGGCSPCLQNNSECKTTDRITGRAVQRGHTETLELENNALRVYMVDLQQQLRDNGIEPKHGPGMPQNFAQAAWNEQSQQQDAWSESSNGGIRPGLSQIDRRISQSSALPDFRPGSIGNNYLGLSTGNGMLSPIEGTRLSLLGLTIDVAEFIPPEDPNPLADPSSYDFFLAVSSGKSPRIPEPPLPPLNGDDGCKFIAQHFFKAVLVFTPILHRPDFYKLLNRRFSPNGEVTETENVTIHIVISIFKFQMALRTRNGQIYTQAIAHYQYAISFVPDLLLGHSLEHVQALALICFQLRQQPRLSAAWWFTNTVLGHAIELGLHRSASAWQPNPAERSPHIVEMRKRVFWSLIVLHANIGSKLGRPMPIRLQDMDIEMPETVPDTLPGEHGLSKWQKCSFRAAIPGMKLLRIMMQVYSTVYSVRPDPEPYEITVRRVDRELELFREQLAPELSGGPQTMDADRVPALYLQTAEEEIRLVLHHPSLSQGAGPEALARNYDICLQSSKRLLAVAAELQRLHSLDNTWYYSTDYLLAIFTTLFVWNQRKDQLTFNDYQQLAEDMGKWLVVMEAVGTGHKLKDHVSGIIEHHLGVLRQHLSTSGAQHSVASSESPISPATTNQMPQAQQPTTYQPSSGYQNTFVERRPSDHLPQNQSRPYPVPQPTSHPHPGYPPPNTYYQEPQATTTMQAYPGMGHFDSAVYPPNDSKPPVVYQAHMSTPTSMPPPPPPPQPAPPPQAVQHQTLMPAMAAPPPQQSSYMSLYSTPPPQTPSVQNGYHPTPPAMNVDYTPAPGPAAWRDFSNETVQHWGGQGYMASATANMSLQSDNKHMTGMGPMQMVQQYDQQLHWPLSQYPPGTMSHQ